MRWIDGCLENGNRVEIHCQAVTDCRRKGGLLSDIRHRYTSHTTIPLRPGGRTSLLIY